MFDEIEIEHLPAKLVLFGIAMIALWVLPGAVGATLATEHIGATQMLIYKIILSLGLLIATHFIVDRIAD